MEILLILLGGALGAVAVDQSIKAGRDTNEKETENEKQ